MKLIDELVARAENADSQIGDLATAEEASLRRRQAYSRLEREFEAMASDGRLDRREIEQLMADFRREGLDTQTLEALLRELKTTDGVASASVSDGLRTTIGEQLQKAKADDRDPNFHLKIQLLMSEYQQSYDLAARVSKAEHEIYMTAIRHLVA